MWGAWRGEASNHIELIEERHFEFTTIGTLILPEHASYWRQLCDHHQLFTVDAHALVKGYLERCLPQGESPTLCTPTVDMHSLSDGAHCDPFVASDKKQFPYTYALVSSMSSLHFLHHGQFATEGTAWSTMGAVLSVPGKIDLLCNIFHVSAQTCAGLGCSVYSMIVYSVCAGGAQEPVKKASVESVLVGALPAGDMQFPVKQPFGTLLACP